MRLHNGRAKNDPVVQSPQCNILQRFSDFTWDDRDGGLAARRAQLLVAEDIGEAIDTLDAALASAEKKMVW